MNQLRFRTRLVLILSLFAIIPALLLTLLWSGTVSTALPLLSGRAGWDSVASTGKTAIAAARKSPLTPSQRVALDAHERELRSSAEQARRFSFLAARTVRLVAFAGILSLLVLTGAASRVAGHLSRQLSRPLDELVRWTDLLAHGQPLPPPAPPIVVESGSGDPVTVTSRVRGAPEFEKLRQSMRAMAGEIEEGRKQAIEAERLQAFRESARRVAHELKNPLTPIRFAIEKLKRDSPYDLGDSIQVLETESKRLERMAASFAQFGKLPEGPASEIDIPELVTYAARSTVPEGMKLELDIAPVPPVIGNHSSIAGALSNVLLNAVDASKAEGTVKVQVSPARIGDRPAVRVSVADNGCGIASEELDHIWEPYVTHKAGGTGLGLAIARQAIWAHDGTVEAKSTLGKGTEIAFTLPVSDNNGSRS